VEAGVSEEEGRKNILKRISYRNYQEFALKIIK
jgi:hypothetical protein